MSRPASWATQPTASERFWNGVFHLLVGIGAPRPVTDWSGTGSAGRPLRARLAWPAQKIAVLYRDDDRTVFDTDGWTVAFLDRGFEAGISALASLLPHFDTNPTDPEPSPAPPVDVAAQQPPEPAAAVTVDDLGDDPTPDGDAEGDGMDSWVISAMTTALRDAGLPAPDRRHQLEAGTAPPSFAWPEVRLLLDSPPRGAEDQQRLDRYVALGWITAVWEDLDPELDEAEAESAVTQIAHRVADRYDDLAAGARELPVDVEVIIARPIAQTSQRRHAPAAKRRTEIDDMFDELAARIAD